MCANAVGVRPLKMLNVRLPEGAAAGRNEKSGVPLGRCGKEGTRTRCFVSDIHFSPITLPVV